MAEYFCNEDIKKHLENIKFLVPRGYGTGVPVYLKKGINAINSFYKEFCNMLDKYNCKYYCYNPDYLVLNKQFSDLYYSINDYSNEVIKYKDKIIISDALLQTLYKLKDLYEIKNSDYSLISLSSIFRDKGNNLVPLYKDKNIYPVIQLDQILSSYKYDDNIEMLKKVYKKFYELLGIKILFLEAREVPQYAEYELYFLATDGNKYTKLGMIYKLSDSFKSNLQIDKSAVLVNSGFSGKSLFISIKNYSESNKFLSIPPLLTINLVYISLNNVLNKSMIEKNFNINNIKFNIKMGEKNDYKRWKNSEALFYLLVHDEYTLYERCGNFKRFKDLESVINYIKYKESKLNLNALIYSENILNKNLHNLNKLICKNCWNKEYYGLIHLDTNEKCEICGSEIDKSIFTANPNDRFY